MPGDLADGMLAMVSHKPAPVGAAARLAAIVRRRARDLEDAALLLDALGLNGDARPPAHVNTARYAHGSQAGVDWHVERGHASLCAACARFVEVRENRAERCAGGGCGSVRFRRIGRIRTRGSRRARRRGLRTGCISGSR